MKLAFTTYIRTTPEQLWEALTTPASTRLYFDFMVGFLAVDSTWETGTSIAYRTDDGEPQIDGRILEIVHPTRLVISFALRYDPEVEQDPPSQLGWKIEQLAEICRLTVTHDELRAGTATSRDVAICMPSILANLKILLETGKPRLIKEIVVDCASPARLGIFWAAALDYIMQGPPPTPEDDFIAIADPQGVGPELGFQRVPEPKQGKNRLHFDLHVTDGAAEIEHLVAMGATALQTFEGWTVMADPEGNEFCVTG